MHAKWRGRAKKIIFASPMLKHVSLTAQSFLVLLIAAFKFSRVSWWYAASPHVKSNLATAQLPSNSTKLQPPPVYLAKLCSFYPNQETIESTIWNHEQMIDECVIFLVNSNQHNMENTETARKNQITRHSSLETTGDDVDRTGFRAESPNDLRHRREVTLQGDKLIKSTTRENKRST